MSAKKLLIWWIDDEPNRLKKLARSRIEQPGHPGLRSRRSTLELKELKHEEQRIELEKELAQANKDGRLPHLVIIDQILNRNDGVVRRGSTVAVAVRAQAPSVPVVGTSAASLKAVAELQKDQFIEFLCLEDIQSGERIPDLFAIADGFAKVLSHRERSSSSGARAKQILRWLDCPKEDLEFLSACLPGDFIGSWDDETPHSFARWVWHTFTGRTGFLNDDLEIATTLGLKSSGLANLSGVLEGCEYKGIFASVTRRRWWVSKVRERVRLAAGAAVTDPLWRVGRQLLTDQHAGCFSKCYGRTVRSCVPDVVAYQDDTQRERVQAKSEDTKLLETDTPPVGFEQRRVYFNR